MSEQRYIYMDSLPCRLMPRRISAEDVFSGWFEGLQWFESRARLPEEVVVLAVLFYEVM